MTISLEGFQLAHQELMDEVRQRALDMAESNLFLSTALFSATRENLGPEKTGWMQAILEFSKRQEN